MKYRVAIDSSFSLEWYLSLQSTQWGAQWALKGRRKEISEKYEDQPRKMVSPILGSRFSPLPIRPISVGSSATRDVRKIQ